jgi:membrane protein
MAADERQKAHEDPDPVRTDYAPSGTDERTGAWPTVTRTATEFMEDGMMDWAAALTYYGLLALFPALIALASVLGLAADPETMTRQLTEIVTEIGPSSAADTFSGPIESITSNKSAAGILFFAGLGVALWSASGYVAAFTRASNVAWETPEAGRFTSCARSRS